MRHRRQSADDGTRCVGVEARLPEQGDEPAAHALQVVDARVDVGQLERGDLIELRAPYGLAAREAQQRRDVGEREAQRLRALDETHAVDIGAVVEAIVAARARRGQHQLAALVETHRRDGHARCSGELPNRQAC